MGFTTLNEAIPSLRGHGLRGRAPRTKCAVAVYDRGKLRPMAQIIIPKPIVELLHWQAGDNIEVLVGTGIDAGRLALRRTLNGAGLSLVETGAGKTQCLKICSTRLGRKWPEALKTTDVRHTLGDDATLVITLPPEITQRQQNGLGQITIPAHDPVTAGVAL